MSSIRSCVYSTLWSTLNIGLCLCVCVRVWGGLSKYATMHESRQISPVFISFKNSGTALVQHKWLWYEGLLPLGLWCMIQSQNTSPKEHDVWFEMHIQRTQEVRMWSHVRPTFFCELLFLLGQGSQVNIPSTLTHVEGCWFLEVGLLLLHNDVIIKHPMLVITSGLSNLSPALSCCNCFTPLSPADLGKHPVGPPAAAEISYQHFTWVLRSQ